MPLHFIQKHPKAKHSPLSHFPGAREQHHICSSPKEGSCQSLAVPTVCNTASQMLILNAAVLTKSIVQFTKTQTPMHSQQEKPYVLVILEVFSKKQSVAMVMRCYH